MSDLFIFLFGCLVSLIVAASVCLLMWGAANEPEEGELPEATQSDSVRVSSIESRKVS